VRDIRQANLDALAPDSILTRVLLFCGDCGYYGRYAFPKGKPVLKEFRVKFECDGNARYPKREKHIQHSPAGWIEVSG
jgi:hypothetical protein